MGIVLYTVTFLGVTALLATGGVYSVMAAEEVIKNKQYDNDDDLKHSHRNLTIASALCWSGIALLIVLIILYIAFGIETIEYTGQYLVIFFLIFILGLTVAVGVLCTIGAADMKKSSNFSPSKNDSDRLAYKDAIIASVLTLGAVLLLVFGGLGIVIYQYVQSNRLAAQQVELQTLLYERQFRQQDAKLGITEARYEPQPQTS